MAKSAFAALRFRLSLSVLMIAVYGFLFLQPLMVLWSGLRGDPVGEQAKRLAGLHMFLNGGLWYAVAVRFRLPRTTALFYPLTVILTIVMIADSVRRVAIGGIGWNSRVYDVRGGELRYQDLRDPSATKGIKQQAGLLIVDLLAFGLGRSSLFLIFALPLGEIAADP